MAVYQIVYVIAVRNGLVAAALAVPVIRFVARTIVRSARCGVLRRYFHYMLIHVVAMWAVHVPVVQIVGVVAVPDGSVPAAFAMDVGMEFVNLMMVSHNCGGDLYYN